MYKTVSVAEYGENMLSVRKMEETDIPPKMNGESGSHIYHVTLLTEIILRELVERRIGYSFTEDEIRDISIAASMHDIGKLRIPQNILNSKERLSPVQFDIVKQHTILGEKMLSSLPEACNVEERIIHYAKVICRYHHERYDGTGYPEGLGGDAIPIYAQVVSIADVFDALISDRSYKKSLSQDAAIEMIANKMAGVFQPVLVECLLKAVQDKSLSDIREQISRSRQVRGQAEDVTPKRVLLSGNTEYVTEEFLAEAFPDSKVTIAGPSALDESEIRKIWNHRGKSVGKLLEAYQYDVILYLSEELTFDSRAAGDTEPLRELLDHAAKTQTACRVIYLSSLETVFENRRDRGIITKAKESLCEYYGNSSNLEIKIVRIPYLYSGVKENDFLYGLFEALEQGEILLSHAPEHKTNFIAAVDAADLIRRILGNWYTGAGALSINDTADVTYQDLCDGLAKLKKVRVVYEDGEPEQISHIQNTAVRSQYGWFYRLTILDELKHEYEKYCRKKALGRLTFPEKVGKFLASHGTVVRTAELFMVFAITEFFVYLTHSALYFSILDFRMAFIVIMATLYGLRYGLAAAGLASLSWLISKMMSGTKLITVFYEPTNWLSFIYYFLIGTICGYVRLKNDNSVRFVQDANRLLQDKLTFTRQLYLDAFHEKRDLKKQILGSRDSFGKIFDITRSLNTVETKELYLKIIENFEEILENRTIAVYSINRDDRFGRLEVSSQSIMHEMNRSISLEEHGDILDGLSSNEVWRNTDLTPDLPMYVKGIYRDNKLVLLILIWRAEPQQYSLYFVNLFKMLCNLTEISLIRAYEFTQMTYSRQYLPGTSIMKPEVFQAELERCRVMREKKIFLYQLVELDCRDRSVEEVGNEMAPHVRQNDILGIGANGKLHLILSQVRESDLSVVLPRIEKLDIGTAVITES